MANTLTLQRIDPPRRRGGQLKRAILLVALSGNYAAGGEDINLSTYFRRIIGAQITPLQDAPGYVWHVNDATFATTRHLLALPYRIAAHAHSLKFKDADVVDGAGTRVNIGTNLIGANTGADITVAPTEGTRGVQQLAAAALAEYTNGVAYPGNLQFLMEVLGD